MKWRSCLFAAALAVGLAAPFGAHADVSELRITREPSLTYMPAMLMEHDHLVEKHARLMGMPDLKVKWTNFASGGAATDALMAGQIHIVTSGTSNMLLLWDRTHGAVKGLAGAASVPFVLVTSDPNVHALKDFTDRDKIAVPTVKVSMQATVLRMAAEKYFGPSQRDRLDPFTVTMGHADAAIAMLSRSGIINTHFAPPPYLQQELRVPGVHKIISSQQVIGPVSNAMFFTTAKFHDANPKVIAIFMAALNDAQEMIHQRPREAAQKYLDTSHDHVSVDELTAIIKDRSNIFSATPYGTMHFADFMYRSGTLKSRPASWKAVYFPEVHPLHGS